MDITELENLALSLPADDRVRLAQRLLGSIESLAPGEHLNLWLHEVARRTAEIDSGAAVLVSGDEVARKAQALLR